LLFSNPSALNYKVLEDRNTVYPSICTVKCLVYMVAAEKYFVYYLIKWFQILKILLQTTMENMYVTEYI
jgi:hypothetical protein